MLFLYVNNTKRQIFTSFSEVSWLDDSESSFICEHNSHISTKSPAQAILKESRFTEHGIWRESESEQIFWLNLLTRNIGMNDKC